MFLEQFLKEPLTDSILVGSIVIFTCKIYYYIYRYNILNNPDKGPKAVNRVYVMSRA